MQESESDGGRIGTKKECITTCLYRAICPDDDHNQRSECIRTSW